MKNPNRLLLAGILCAATVSGTAGRVDALVPMTSVASDAKELAKSYTDSTLVPYLKGLTELTSELKAANTAREKWPAYTEDWKKWTPEEAEKHKDSFTYGEYLWSGKKDKDFRGLHTGSKAAKALKEFQASPTGLSPSFSSPTTRVATSRRHRRRRTGSRATMTSSRRLMARRTASTPSPLGMTPWARRASR